jgi:geranylgeranyl diphosphate synthase type II|tara:strand:+ start:1028 stop:1981 length:954 start_codon:yes stop_codon:yes gene_type:complete
VRHQNGPASSAFNTSIALDIYFKELRRVVDAELERLLPAPPQCPPLISEIMRYSVFAGGKRFRPILTLAASQAVSQKETILDGALRAACAVEMIHTYSLVHDDLPSMDDDTLRRGRPTAHVVYGEGMAILAGDALLTEAFNLLAQPTEDATTNDQSRALRALHRIAVESGATGMVGGQVLDLQLTGHPVDKNNSEMLRAMHAKKTGALIKAAAVAGAIMAKANDTTVKVIDTYATHLGLAFQIIDDILDVEGASDALGKTVGKDAAAGKVTYPGIYGIEESKNQATAAVHAAQQALDNASLGGRLSEISNWVLNRSR